MNNFLIFAYIFFIGSLCGWVIELIYRRYFSSENKDRKWINPGFCKGPYLPIYGLGLCILYFLASMKNQFPTLSILNNKALLFFIMSICMTLLEYLAGILCLKIFNVRLWDYSNEKFNVQGIICPKFSLAWTILGAIYYFVINPHILDALQWLANNLAFSFVIGMFFGVFIIDAVYSSKIIILLKEFATENQVIIRYENLKTYIYELHELQKKKYHFFNPLYTDRPLSERLNEMKEQFEQNKK